MKMTSLHRSVTQLTNYLSDQNLHPALDLDKGMTLIHPDTQPRQDFKQSMATTDVRLLLTTMTTLFANSQPLTAFNSEEHGKRYCFKRCPQELRKRQLHLQLVIDQLFSLMSNDIIHYANDIMIATEGTLREHIDCIADRFTKLEHAYWIFCLAYTLSSTTIVIPQFGFFNLFII